MAKHYVNEGVFEGVIVKRQPKKDAKGVNSITVGQALGVQGLPFYPNDEAFAKCPAEGEEVRIKFALKPKQTVGRHENVVNQSGITVLDIEPMVKTGAGPGLAGQDDPFRGGKPLGAK